MGLGAVEFVLVRQANHQLVNQRIAQAGHLHPGATCLLTGLVARRRAAVEQTGLAHAGRGPAANDGIGTRCQTVLVHFKRNGGDVVFLDVMLATHARSVLVGWVEQERRRRIHQVKHGTQIDGKAFLALPNEYLAHILARRAARNLDAVHVQLGIGLVGNRVAQCFGANIVHRLFERLGGAIALGDGGDGTLAPIAAHDVDRIGFVEVQVRVDQLAYGAGLDQRNGDLGGADVECDVVEFVIETELEGNVFFGVTIVVQVDFVQGIGVHREVVGATVGALQRLVVGQHGDVVTAPAGAGGTNAFITAEHVKVRTVHLGRGGDKRCFAVAGGQRGTRRQHQNARLGQSAVGLLHR